MESHYVLDCPVCGAPPSKAKLEVRAGHLKARGLPLTAEGYCLNDADKIVVEAETAFCAACETVFPLNRCIKEGDIKYPLYCALCLAPPEKAKLLVVQGTFLTKGMPLYADGCSLDDADTLSVMPVYIECQACGKGYRL
jgi:hypothetical protein